MCGFLKTKLLTPKTPGISELSVGFLLEDYKFKHEGINMILQLQLEHIPQNS